MAGISALLAAPPPALAELLDPIELAITLSRAQELLDAGVLPAPDEDGPYPPYPWPLI